MEASTLDHLHGAVDKYCWVIGAQHHFVDHRSTSDLLLDCHNNSRSEEESKRAGQRVDYYIDCRRRSKAARLCTEQVHDQLGFALQPIQCLDRGSCPDDVCDVR